MRRMDPSAPGLLRAVELLADGPVPWGRPVPAVGSGVFVVELPAPRATAPIELTRIGKWLERVESLRLDGKRPSSRALAARLDAFWLPSQVVLYVGATPTSIANRVRALRETTLGERRPHPGGHWLQTLTGLEQARIWWAATDAVEEYEDALLAAFGEGVPAAERAALPDREVVLPFANLRTPTGSRKQTGLTGSILSEPVAPAPPTHVVQLPDGDADGARGEPPAFKTRAAPKATSSRRTVAPKPEVSTRAAEQVQLTPDGAARLQEELRLLTEGRRPEVVARIRAAKELGDLKENADYHAAREEQSFLEGRIQALQAKLRDAVIAIPPSAGQGADLGSSVTVEADGLTVTYTLVGSAEAAPSAGRVSVQSPVGRALIGATPGTEVIVETPRGSVLYRVLAVE
jgi:transcription elongation factor GreA